MCADPAVLRLASPARVSAAATRLLLWSSVAFAGLALNNVLLFIDLIVVLSIDLSVLTAGTAVAAIMCFSSAWSGKGATRNADVLLGRKCAGVLGDRVVLPALLAERQGPSLRVLCRGVLGAGLNWVALVVVRPSDEARHIIYLVRFVAFLLLSYGIIDKNITAKRK